MNQLKPWDDARREYVLKMFGAIAERYDLMNRVMTLGQDVRWRREAADAAAVAPGQSALDIATGTGDMALELAGRVAPNGHVVGIDFSPEMLEIARQKVSQTGLPVVFEQADALALPYPDTSFDAATCAFGVRNFEDRQKGLGEMARVTRSGGRVVILELTPPKNSLARLYMDQVVPRLGELIARAREAYTYLPESVQQFPDAVVLGRMMYFAGLTDVKYRLLNVGTIAIHWATKP
jgi:demethylmenaquinone methyltransferase/2-methoxy-6-polyprenyl-1,4-benzoquinol methylase